MDSRKEFNGRSIEDVQQNFFLSELPSRKDCEYRYHKLGLKAPPGTAVLFQYNCSLIASAVLNRTERFGKAKGGYEGALYFDARSIKIFDPIGPTDVFRIWPEFKGFGRAKWSLNPARYPTFITELLGIETAKG
jgi:hypothetical protein